MKIFVCRRKYVFNKINQVGILRLQMLLSLVITCFVESNGTASFLHSRQGVAQGGPLIMIAQGIGIFPLIKNLKREILEVTQPWYADYARALGTFARLETYFDLLTRRGLAQRILRPDFFQDDVMDLRCVWVHIILGVVQVMTSPNTIV